MIQVENTQMIRIESLAAYPAPGGHRLQSGSRRGQTSLSSVEPSYIQLALKA
jgi:hypothetical protein